MSYASQSEQSATVPGPPGVAVDHPNQATASDNRVAEHLPAGAAPEYTAPKYTAPGLTATLAEQNEILDRWPPTQSDR